MRKLYALSNTLTYKVSSGILIRTDWLEKVGMMPTTADEPKAVLKAFKDNLVSATEAAAEARTGCTTSTSESSCMRAKPGGWHRGRAPARRSRCACVPISRRRRTRRQKEEPVSLPRMAASGFFASEWPRISPSGSCTEKGTCVPAPSEDAGLRP